MKNDFIMQYFITFYFIAVSGDVQFEFYRQKFLAADVQNLKSCHFGFDQAMELVGFEICQNFEFMVKLDFICIWVEDFWRTP